VKINILYPRARRTKEQASGYTPTANLDEKYLAQRETNSGRETSVRMFSKKQQQEWFWKLALSGANGWVV
jgi:hypothetical protein